MSNRLGGHFVGAMFFLFHLELGNTSRSQENQKLPFKDPTKYLSRD